MVCNFQIVYKVHPNCAFVKNENKSTSHYYYQKKKTKTHQQTPPQMYIFLISTIFLEILPQQSISQSIHVRREIWKIKRQKGFFSYVKTPNRKRGRPQLLTPTSDGKLKPLSLNSFWIEVNHVSY